MPTFSPRFVPRTRLLMTTAAVLFALFALLHQMYFARSVSAAISVFINEIHYDNAGTDAGEAIEVAGPAGTNLTGWSLVLYNAANGAVYDTDALTAVIPNQQNGFGTVSLSYPVNGIQNGSPDGLALVNSSGAVVQFLSYEGAFTAVDGPANGMVSTDIGVSENGTEAAGQSLRLSGTGQSYEDFTWNGPAVNTFGAINTGQTFTGGGGDTAPAVSSTTPADGSMNVVTGANISVTFSENVNVAGNWFQISCTASGLRQVADTSVNGGPTTFTINPTNDFAASEQCTVTVFSAQVTDQDTSDPPDNMASNAAFSFTVASPPVLSNVIINEVDSDTPGTDVAEFIELYDGGVGGTSLNGLVVVLYNGSNDLSYAAFDLDGRSTDSNGYFVLGNAAVPGVDLSFNNGLLQNGADAVALYAADATSFPNNTPVTTANLIDAVVYDTADSDDPGLLVLLNAGEAQVDEDAGGNAANDSIQRCPNGSGGARNTSAYIARAPSPDGTNNCPVPPVARSIPEIQGSGAASPFVGTSVITTGIVTLLKSNGFFLQTSDADTAVENNPDTSQGIFVFTAGVPSVAVGDGVTVTGSISEFFNLTEVSSSAANVTVNTSGNTLPAPVALTTTILSPAGPLDQLERFEGMRIHADMLISVAPTNGFGEIFTVLDGVARPFREPGIEISLSLPPGAPCCVPRFDENPEKIMIDSDGKAGATPIDVTSGVTFTNVTGPLDFSFSNYKILPDTPPGLTPNLSAVPVPTPTANEFTVGSFNLENFFSTAGNFSTRLAKASLAIRNVMNSPDVIGVEEVGDLTTLQALATRINIDAVTAGQPNPNYLAYLEETDIDAENDIDVGFLVRTSRVNVVSVTQEGANETYINPANNQPELLNDRAPLVLRATIQTPGGSLFPFTVIVNHLRSLIDVDQDPGDGPRVRAKRRAQAEYLANLVQSMQSENLILVGDFNAFQLNDGYVDVIGTIKGQPTHPENVVLASSDLVNPDLTNLVDTLAPQQRYSFSFEGNAQVLDHVLSDPEMLVLLSRFFYARNNADFPEFLFSNDATRPERVSDHDMPVAYFTFPPPAADLVVDKEASSSTVTSGSSVTYTITVTNNGPDNADSAIVTDNLPVGVTFVSCTATNGGSCSNTGNNVTINYASLAIAASSTITIETTVNCNVAHNTSITNTASGNSAYSDPDTDNNSDSADITVDNPLPTISGASVDKPILWPPSHKMVDVEVNYTISDNCGPVTASLSVTSNEPVNGQGDGNSAPDWEIVDSHHVRLRAERSGEGNGRIYTITITATDSGGGTSTQQVMVRVPKNGGQ